MKETVRLALFSVVLVGGCGHDTESIEGCGDGCAEVTVDFVQDLGVFNPYLFGTVGARSPASISLLQDLGIRLLQVGGVNIPQNVNDPSQYDFTSLDQQISALVNAGIEPFVMFEFSEKPGSLTDYATYVQNVARHLTQGWNNGHTWPIKVLRFGNEPDNSGFYDGTPQDHFETYATWARALKAVDQSFVLVAPALTAGVDRSDNLSSWVTGFLSYCESNNVPIDYFSIHAYSTVPYSRFHKQFSMVWAELEKYPFLSPLYGVPRLANDEWNFMLGDVWSGSYHTGFDTAWAAASNIGALINMVEEGLQLSIRFGGPDNGGSTECHDFPMTDCDQNGKPVYYAFKGFCWLAGTSRLATTGTDHMNLAAMAGKRANGEVIVVLSNNDISSYLANQGHVPTKDHDDYDDYVSAYGTPPVYSRFKITFGNLPWEPSQRVTYERYAVDDQHNLELHEMQTVSGAASLSFAGDMAMQSVQFIKLHAE